MQNTAQQQPALAPVMNEGGSGCVSTLTSGVVPTGTALALAQLAEQRNALVNALQARASMMARQGPSDSRGSVVSETGEIVEHGEQMVWFTRLRWFVQKGLEPVFGRLMPLPTASPTSWYSQSPTWSLATPNFTTPEQPRPQGLVENQPRSLPGPPVPEHIGDQSSTGSIQPEVVQEEVRKAVQQEQFTSG